MNLSFLVIDFIIFTAAATAGFIWGAMWVDSEFEKDSAYLAAEVESLNEALDVLEEQYQELDAKYHNEVSPNLQRKIREAWRESDRDIDLG